MTEVWIRGDGSEIELNTKPATRAYAESQGWVLKVQAEKAKKPRVKRSKKDVNE